MSDYLGTYRNSQGVTLEITGLRMDRDILGVVYDAVQKDSTFGPRHLLITLDGLRDYGYEKIEETP